MHLRSEHTHRTTPGQRHWTDSHEPLVPLPSPDHPPLQQRLRLSDFHHHRRVLSGFIFYVNEFIQCQLFCVWFLLLQSYLWSSSMLWQAEVYSFFIAVPLDDYIIVWKYFSAVLLVDSYVESLGPRWMPLLCLCASVLSRTYASISGKGIAGTQHFQLWKIPANSL